jgi:hypothetical protein
VSASVAFPSYNIALGFWGAYCSFSKHGRATFGFILLAFLSLAIDIAFCCINGMAFFNYFILSIYNHSGEDSNVFNFALAMLIICMFLKVAFCC